MLNKPKTLSTKKPLHRTIFTHVFSTQKTFDTEKHVHTDCTHIVLQTDFFAGKHFTQNNFYTTCFLRTDAFKNAQKKAQQFLQTDGLYTQKVLRTEVLRIESFMHNIAQLFFAYRCFYADVFTQTQIAHRNLCTQHAFTHSHPLRKEALLPLLDHLPFVFPLSSDTLLITLRSYLNHCFTFCDNTGHWHDRCRDILQGFQTSPPVTEYCMFWKNTASL